MPHLQELVKLHQDAPFALIGINSNDAPEDYRKGLEKYGVTWISAYQGREDAISRLYHVQYYPSYFLIDAGGKLVRTAPDATELDEEIARLLAALEAERGR